MNSSTLKSTVNALTPSTSHQSSVSAAETLIERFDAVMSKMLIILKHIYGTQRLNSINMFYCNAKKAAVNEFFKSLSLSKVILFCNKLKKC